jgi:ElaB/YqjD/DUF883 family membrane-anchored ribosome-binding protein
MGMRDSTNQAREAARDLGRAGAAASGEIQNDLQKLRDDFARLAEQVAGIAAGRGSAAWQHAMSDFESVISDAHDQGDATADAMRERADKFVETIDESIKNRPYMTLAIALGLGFLFGATWRR